MKFVFRQSMMIEMFVIAFVEMVTPSDAVHIG